MRSPGLSLVRRLCLLAVLVAVAVLSVAPAHAQAPHDSIRTPLQRELDSLTAAPASVPVVARLRQIDDSLATVERRLEQRVNAIRAGLRAPAVAPLPVLSAAHSAAGRRLALGLVPLAFIAGSADRDPGGYVDSYRLQSDKAAHAALSAVIAQSLAPRVGTRWAAGSCVAAGLAYELGQRRAGGYASRFDAAYDAGGCVAGLALHRLFGRGR